MALLPAQKSVWPEGHDKLAKAQGQISWSHWALAIELDIGYVVCGAKAKSTNAPCRNYPMTNGRCKLHGGKTPIGHLSPHWKTGEYSRLFPTLPERFQEKARAAHDDPELVSTRRQIAVLEAREDELLGQLSTGESGAAWLAAGKLMQDIGRCDEDKVPSLMSQLESTISEGLSDTVLWREIQENMETARRLRDSELNRLKALHAAVSTKDAKDMMARLLAIVKDSVGEPEILRLILVGVDREFGGRQGGGDGEVGARGVPEPGDSSVRDPKAQAKTRMANT